MILITMLVFLIQIISLLIFKPLTEIINYFVQINLIPTTLIIIFAFLISKDTV